MGAVYNKPEVAANGRFLACMTTFPPLHSIPPIGDTTNHLLYATLQAHVLHSCVSHMIYFLKPNLLLLLAHSPNFSNLSHSTSFKKF